MRSDAYRMMNTRRVLPNKVSDIGSWGLVFQLLVSVAILTNVGMICFITNRGYFEADTDKGTRWMYAFFLAIGGAG